MLKAFPAYTRLRPPPEVRGVPIISELEPFFRGRGKGGSPALASPSPRRPVPGLRQTVEA